MKEKIREILNAVETFNAGSMDELEEFRIKYLSKKGVIPALFEVKESQAPGLPGRLVHVIGTRSRELSE